MPVTPGSITSGTAPQRVAITGVPHAIDSIMTSPNGSSHSIGNSVAGAFWSSSTFSPCVTSPRYSIRSERCPATYWRKYSSSSGSRFLPAIFSGSPGLDRGRDRAVAALLPAHPAQEEQVVAAVRLHRVEGELDRVRAVADPRQVGLRLALVHRDRG